MGNENIIFVDILFFINLSMNFALLWATGKFMRTKTPFKRLGIAAFLGSIYSIVILYPPLYLAGSSIAIKVGVSVILIIIAFYPQTLKKYMQLSACFYLVAFAAGGAMLAALYLTKDIHTWEMALKGQSLFILQLDAKWLFAGIFVAVIIGKYAPKTIRERIFTQFLQVPVVICIGDVKVSIQALLDTGNQLKDPITGTPVMVAEIDAIQKLIPNEAFSALKKINCVSDLDQIINHLSVSNLASRIRVIPFTSLGNEKGILMGFKPDSILIVHNNRTIKIKSIIVGIYNKKLSSKGLYNGLMHPDVLQMAIEG